MPLFKKSNRTIWVELNRIFLGFIILVSGSVLATSLALERQATDILVLDLVNHQSVYINNIARSIFGLQINTQKDKYYLNLIELDQSNQGFKETQDALLNGGQVTYGNSGKTISIPATQVHEIIGVLNLIEQLQNNLDNAVETLLTNPTDLERSRAITQIENYIPILYQQINQLSYLFQGSASRNSSTLRSIQILFFLSAVGLLVWGYNSVNRSIIKPLKYLDLAANEIAEGNLNKLIRVDQQDEVGALAKSLDIMRKEIAKGQQELLSWTNTLETRVKLRTKEISTLLDINANVFSKRNIDDALHFVTKTARDLLDGEMSVICLLNETTNNLTVASANGPKAALKRTHAQVESGFLSKVVRERETIAHAACSGCPILSETVLNEVVVAPLQINQIPIGAVCVADSKKKKHDDNTSTLLTFLANSAATAIENARLFNQTETIATLAERERIAEEMHDGLAQTLGYLNLKTDQAISSLNVGEPETTKSELKLMQPAIQDAYDTVRQWLSGLSDNSISHDGFKSSLTKHILDLEEKNILVNIDIDDSYNNLINEDEKIQLLRIAQECLTNIRKYSQATEVDITIKNNSNIIILFIGDNGIGFDPAGLIEDGQSHLGLKIMRGRIERVQGSLTIQSKPGQGTQIIARVPISS